MQMRDVYIDESCLVGLQLPLPGFESVPKIFQLRMMELALARELRMAGETFVFAKPMKAKPRRVKSDISLGRPKDPNVAKWREALAMVPRELKLRQYCEYLTKHGVQTPKRWRNRDDYPRTYDEAWKDPRFRGRIAQERRRAYAYAAQMKNRDDNCDTYIM